MATRISWNEVRSTGYPSWGMWSHLGINLEKAQSRLLDENEHAKSDSSHEIRFDHWIMLKGALNRVSEQPASIQLIVCEVASCWRHAR